MDGKLEPEVYHLNPEKSDTETFRNVIRCVCVCVCVVCVVCVCMCECVCACVCVCVCVCVHCSYVFVVSADGM